MKRTVSALLLSALAFSSVISAAELDGEKEFQACLKTVKNDREINACQERLLERLNMNIAKALDANKKKLPENEKRLVDRYQEQWNSWRQSHCDFSLRENADHQKLTLACYLQVTKDRLNMLLGNPLESNTEVNVCLRRAGKIESQALLCLQAQYRNQQVELEKAYRSALMESPSRKMLQEQQRQWEKSVEERCKTVPFTTIEKLSERYDCLSEEIEQRINKLLTK